MAACSAGGSTATCKKQIQAPKAGRANAFRGIGTDVATDGANAFCVLHGGYGRLVGRRQHGIAASVQMWQQMVQMHSAFHVKGMAACSAGGSTATPKKPAKN